MTIYLVGSSASGLAWQEANRPDQPVARITHPSPLRGRRIVATDRIVWLGGLNAGIEARLWVELGVAVAHAGLRLVDLVEVTETNSQDPEPGGSRPRCPVHDMPDCSPLLNGCSRLTSPQPGGSR